MFCEMNIKKVTQGEEGLGVRGTFLISSWTCNYQYLLVIQVYYLDMQYPHFCNTLPNEVAARTVNSFKNSLDKHWAENPPNVLVNW